MKPQSLRIRGHWWSVKVAEAPPEARLRARLKTGEAWCGVCDHETKTIYLNPQEPDKANTLNHEVLHACYPRMSEAAVEAGEDALRNAMALKL